MVGAADGQGVGARDSRGSYFSCGRRFVRGAGWRPAFLGGRGGGFPACGGTACRDARFVVDIDPFVIDGFVNGRLFRTYGALSPL